MGLSCYRLLIKRLSLLIVILFSIGKLQAQTDFQIGSGKTGNNSTGVPAPIQDYNEGSRAQYLFLKSELTAAGMSTGKISAIKFTITALNGAGVVENMMVKIGHTSSSGLPFP